MGLEKAFHDLSGSASKLRERLAELRLTVVEDRPRSAGGPVVDRFEYAVEELLGWLHELAAAALEAERAVRGPANLDQARQTRVQAAAVSRRTPVAVTHIRVVPGPPSFKWSARRRIRGGVAGGRRRTGLRTSRIPRSTAGRAAFRAGRATLSPRSRGLSCLRGARAREW